MIKLLEKNAEVRAIPHKRRSLPGTINKLRQMEDMLSKMLSLWPINADQLIKNSEDLLFLQSMKSDRLATFGPRDKQFAQKFQRRLKRFSSKVASHERLCTNTIPNTANASKDNSEISSDANDNSESENDFMSSSDEHKSLFSISHHRTSHTRTTVFIPPDIIRQSNLVALATRLKMTPAQQAIYTQALVEESGGDSSKVSTSYSTADRSRRQVGDDLAETIKQKWIAPKLATLHWDSKLMSSLSNESIEERLTAVVGTTNSLTFLGASAYKPGTDRKSGDILINTNQYSAT